MIDIYKASAGSGKTYALTRRYLLMLLGEKRQDGARALRRSGSMHHRDILAITFTNKATDEMKRRIVHELALMAGMEGDCTDRGSYFDDFCTELDCTADELQEAARKALRQLLIDFSFFHVSTIDAFFQSVLRTFAREAELTGNFELEIDQNFIIAMGVVALMQELSVLSPAESRSSELMAWLVRFMEQSVNDGKRFNLFNRKSTLFRELLNLMKTVYRENFTVQAEPLHRYLENPERLRRFSKECSEALARERAAAKKAVENLFDEFKVHGIEPANTISSRLMGFFKKCPLGNLAETPGKTAAGCLNNPDSVFPAKNRTRAIATTLAYLQPHVVEVIADVLRRRERVVMLNLVTSNVFMLGLVARVMHHIDEYCRENNLFVLGNTNQLLRTIIGEDDAPVVYERMGLWLNHFLIDEFQDTSRLQWDNLAPLLAESLSSGNDNLIIGDEKQCIYRFRNSDPSLLHTEVATRFPAEHRITGDDVAGNTNWRSTPEVVRFNNTLFTLLAAARPVIAPIYSGVVQQVASRNLKRKGYVRLRKFDVGTKAEFEECTLIDLAEQIRRQLDAGYAPKDIAVLTRKRQEAAAVIEYLFTLGSDPESDFPAVSVVSEDSLYISTAPAVRMIVSLLRYLTAAPPSSPRKVSARVVASMTHRYEHLCSTNPHLSRREALEQVLAEMEAQTDTADPDARPAEPSVEIPVDTNPGSLVERLISDFITPEMRLSQSAYIAAFQDAVADYCERAIPDVRGFLNWWDADGHRRTVSVPESDNAIHVLTVHKSKGLEFDCVHIPFASWAIPDLKGSEWFATNPGDFKDFVSDLDDVPPMLLLDLKSKGLEESSYGPHYLKLRDESEIDQMNVAYVALTRAVRELTVNFYRPSGTSLGSLLDDTLSAMTDATATELWERTRASLPEGSPSVFVGVTRELEDDMYTIGVPTTPEPKKAASLSTIDPREMVEMPIYPAAQRTDIWEEADIERELDYDRYCDRGIILHAIMRRVTCAADIEPAARRFASRGIISEAEVADVTETLTRRMADPRARQWFEGCRRVLTERPVCDAEGRNHRPDRVVWTAEGTIDIIDYKTGEPSASYNRQLRRYMRLFQGFGLPVRGFVWYLASGTIHQVNP